jgi:hypothetical protein
MTPAILLRHEKLSKYPRRLIPCSRERECSRELNRQGGENFLIGTEVVPIKFSFRAFPILSSLVLTHDSKMLFLRCSKAWEDIFHVIGVTPAQHNLQASLPIERLNHCFQKPAL